MSAKEFTFIDCNIPFNEKPFLKQKDIREGKVYIAKDGRLLLYLGLTTNGQYLFYQLCSLYFKNVIINGKDV
jgi:hypothetical protein